MLSPMQFAQGTVSTSGDNEVIEAQGVGDAIELIGLQLQNASSTATTVTLKFGATEILPTLLAGEGDGLVRDFNHPIPVPENTAVNLNLDGANDTLYGIFYRVKKG